MTKKTYKLDGLHCASCSMVIEGELEDQLGVKAACSWAKQVVEVEGEVEMFQIKQVVEAQGYRVVGEA